MVETRSRGESRYKSPSKHRKDSIQRPVLVDIVRRALLLARFRRVIVQKSCNQSHFYFFRIFVFFPRTIRRVISIFCLGKYLYSIYRKASVIKMPTCACENRFLDEESHVCQLKPPVENDEEETQEYDPAVRYLIFFLFVLSWIRYVEIEKETLNKFINYIIVWKIRITYLIKKMNC